nr:sulfite oxidase [Quercus suber]
MKFLRGPSDYSQEPPRHPSLIINSQEPFNAEPSRSPLISSSYVTPVDLFYKRNHGPVPIVDDIERYQVSICGLVEKSMELSIADMKKLPKHIVTATLQCAGNRRTAMSKVKTVKGVGWDVCAIGNAIWGGAKLADVLELVGIPNLASITPLGGKHVEFISVDKCKEENGGPYKASIPLIQATTSDSEVILAYEMNGEPLNRDHGYPLRVIVPGVIGARSVKWLDSINIIAEECQCAGNRRTAMSKVKTVKGVGWDVCAIGNAIWGGAKLADVLELVGIPNLASITPLGGKHVEFISVDRCKEENGGPYKASIPLIQATTSDSEVILAYEMNGEVHALLNGWIPLI